MRLFFFGNRAFTKMLSLFRLQSKLVARCCFRRREKWGFRGPALCPAVFPVWLRRDIQLLSFRPLVPTTQLLQGRKLSYIISGNFEIFRDEMCYWNSRSVHSGSIVWDSQVKHTHTLVTWLVLVFHGQPKCVRLEFFPDRLQFCNEFLSVKHTSYFVVVSAVSSVGIEET